MNTDKLAGLLIAFLMFCFVCLTAYSMYNDHEINLIKVQVCDDQHH